MCDGEPARMTGPIRYFVFFLGIPASKPFLTNGCRIFYPAFRLNFEAVGWTGFRRRGSKKIHTGWEKS
jgi:hypothetical protein